MQKQGGGKRNGKQQGGGNDPTCGCDMQAGWPPASSFPRGGLQGGAIKEAKFSFSYNDNEGKSHSYEGTLKKKNNKGNNNKRNNLMNESMTMNNNVNSMNMKTNKTKKNKPSSAPNGYNNLALKGKKYYKKRNSGEVFEITNNGGLGKSMGFYVTPKSGKPYLTQMPPPLENEKPETPNVNLKKTVPITPIKTATEKLETEMPPEPEENEPMTMTNNNNANGDSSPDPESEAPEGEENQGRSLSMNGGRRRRRSTRRKRHGKKKTQRKH